MRSLRRGAFVASAIAIAAIGLPFSQSARAAPTSTNYIFRGTGYGTDVVGGVLPANSGKTAYSVLPCTTSAGVTRENNLAGVDLAGLVQVDGMDTVNLTESTSEDIAASITRSEVASVTIGTELAHLELSGIRTIARAWHTSTGYHRRHWVTIGDAELVLAGVPVLDFDISDLFTPQGITIPGIATITGQLASGKATDTGAWTKATALRVELLPVTGTPAVIEIGRANATIGEKDSPPLVGGSVYAAQAVALDGVIEAGRVANQPLPCKGTDGEWLENTTANVNVPGVLTVNGATSSTFGRFVNDATFARGMSDVANVSLLGGSLKIEGVHTQGLVNKRPDKSYRLSTAGTTLARITFNGNEIELPDLGETVGIPGVAEITFGKIEEFPRRLTLIGVEVKLLDSGVIIELGKVDLFVR